MIDIDIEKMKKQLKSGHIEFPDGMTKQQACIWLAEKRIERRKQRERLGEIKL